MRSAQAEKGQDRHDHYEQTDEIDQAVHHRLLLGRASLPMRRERTQNAASARSSKRIATDAQA
jgi:hypothetical protein